MKQFSQTLFNKQDIEKNLSLLSKEIKKLCTHFTIRDIGCIIDLITDTAKRAATNASGGAVFDKLFADAAAYSGTRR